MCASSARRSTKPYTCYTFGDGPPALVVVGCLHGDERCGKAAIEGFVGQRPDVDEPVKLIVANERAARAGKRSIDEDLNRAFPGDKDSDSHEKRLAAALLDEVGDAPVLDLHSTESSDEPFALLQRFNERTIRLARSTGVENAVDISAVGGGFVGHVDGVAVECGRKGDERAVRNAQRILERVLAASGVIEGRTVATDPRLYTVRERVGEGDETFLAENFSPVAAGETYASDGEPIAADESFVPVLMSDDGYEDFLGFVAHDDGRLSSRLE
jgi:predicted deacylase